MPALTDLDELRSRAASALDLPPVRIVVDDDAARAMEDSLDCTGLLLLGELHGVRQTPQLIAALIEQLDIGVLALEWPQQLTPTVEEYRRTGVLHDHDLLWLGDGRLTPGHLALLRDLAQRDPAIGLLAFDSWGQVPDLDGASPWTARDHAMARRILEGAPPTGRTLVVAGNAHTLTEPTANGIPAGAWLTQTRPGLGAIRINYGDGTIYNLGTRTLSGREQPIDDYRVRLDDDRLLLDHPARLKPTSPTARTSSRSPTLTPDAEPATRPAYVSDLWLIANRPPPPGTEQCRASVGPLCGYSSRGRYRTRMSQPAHAMRPTKYRTSGSQIATGASEPSGLLAASVIHTGTRARNARVTPITSATSSASIRRTVGTR
ncbi:hypothetical protein [Pseudonocardia oroxyli]|uniref:Uncharacterized protein n=1 Tax=Pseudonocardia oroxyli TaxID=366584 RepID=A0A1G8EFD8_PSEOR|nr:hypothetical protein [Pseudonocardia oroxyli]SDH68577.1 hypothetical protein SAMN05216377_13511 [Pseudonocardia oroxyli]